MKTIFLSILILIAFQNYAQDTTRTPIGYDIDYPHLYVRIDIIHGLSYFYNHYPYKMYFSVNGAKAQLISRGQVFTVWSTHPIIIVSRKRYRREYVF